MTVPIQNLRSGTASKRPVATGLTVGQIAVNYNEEDPAIYLRGNADALVKVAPVYVGSGAPNAVPASGGASGNTIGEQWLDKSLTPPVQKVWDGSQWVPSFALASGVVIESPALSGVPTAPTASLGTDTTQVATTAFVNAEIANDAPTKTGGGASGTWDISISGNAATATALSAVRTITLAGDLTGSATFDGSADFTISGQVADDSHNHTIANVSGLQTALDGKAPLASPTFTGTVTIPAGASIDGYAKLATAQTFTALQTLSSGAALSNSNLTSIKTATFNSQVSLGSTSGSIAINWSAAQNYRQPEPTGTITYTFTAPPGPCHLQLFIDSDGSSTAQTINWPGTVTFLGSSWTGDNNKKAVINLWYDGTNYFAIGTNQP